MRTSSIGVRSSDNNEDQDENDNQSNQDYLYEENDIPMPLAVKY